MKGQQVVDPDVLERDIFESTSDRNAWNGAPSFSLRNRIYRALWWVTWKLLVSWTPPLMRGWRRSLLRLFGAKIASTANVYGSSRIWSPANLTLDSYALIGPGTVIYSQGKIHLEDHAIVSQGAHLCAGTHDVEDPNFQLQTRPILIKARAWVAADAFVGPGVTIGEGAVLGARSCAMRDVAPWMIYTGNPAVPLRQRRIRFK